MKAVDGVSFDIAEGEVMGLVGESGGGKSVVGFSILGLIDSPGKIEGGQILLDGEDLVQAAESRLRKIRGRDISMVFQDPMTSLNPLHSIGRQMNEVLRLHSDLDARARHAACVKMLESVGISRAAERLKAYPHQFSGGQRQRIGIARALSVTPGLIVADEPVSALDVSIQAQILNLMKDLRDEFGLAYLFISHDLPVVHHIADRVGVMYLGFMVESAPRDVLFSRPRHPYTRALLSAAPSIKAKRDKQEIELTGEVPSALSLPTGCCFRTRCPFAWDRCAAERPTLRDMGDGQTVACHLVDEPERDVA